MLVNDGNNMDDNNDLEASQNKQQHAWLQQHHQPNQHQNALKQIHVGANPEFSKPVWKNPIYTMLRIIAISCRSWDFQKLASIVKCFPHCAPIPYTDKSINVLASCHRRSNHPTAITGNATPCLELRVVQLFLHLCTAVQAL
ncbi:hypothetical protein ACA910_000123 [Epithemia clementina (nom. ined.)]